MKANQISSRFMSDVMGTALNLAWPWFPSCIVSEAPELDTLTHLSTWWLWVAKRGKQKGSRSIWKLTENLFKG